jgi:hypothetical protein
MPTNLIGAEMDVEVMPEGFIPRRRGRKPNYDISDVLAGLTQHPGHWVKFKLSLADGKSAQRQLARMGFDVATEQVEVAGADMSVLYVRSK